MRKVNFIKCSLGVLFVLVLTSCSTTNFLRNYTDQELIFDFRPQLKAGFYVSEEGYFGQYDPVGSIHLTIYKWEKRVTQGEPYGFGDDGERVETKERNITPEYLINKIVDKAKTMGADGIIKFYVTPEIETINSSMGISSIVVGYNIKGFAIKRK